MGIKELINEKINDWDDCLNRHYGGETQNSDVLIRAALSDMEQLKSSLPTQQGETVVPVVKQFIADWYEENKRDLDYKIWAYIYDFDSQDQSEFCKWMNNRLNNPIETLIRMKDGYTVEKEQLYIVKVGELAFVNWEDSMLAKMTTMDSPGWVNEANHFTTKVQANEIAKIIGGEAVPVMEDE